MIKPHYMQSTIKLICKNNNNTVKQAKNCRSYKSFTVFHFDGRIRFLQRANLFEYLLDIS